MHAEIGLNPVEQFTAPRVLEEKKHHKILFPIAEEFDYVVMIQSPMNENFFFDRLHHFATLYRES